MGTIGRMSRIVCWATFVLLVLLVVPGAVALAHEDVATAAVRPGAPDPELDEAQGLTQQVRQDLARGLATQNVPAQRQQLERRADLMRRLASRNPRALMRNVVPQPSERALLAP